MRYMFLIYNDENLDPTPGSAQAAKRMDAYRAFSEDVAADKSLLAGDRLQPIAAATTVRIRDGRTQVTDGPFAETKEQLGGYYILECANLDQALARAAQIPSALTGSIEVRPIVDM